VPSSLFDHRRVCRIPRSLLMNRKPSSMGIAGGTTSSPTDSPFWKGLMKVKEDFFCERLLYHKECMETEFWEDTWLGNKSLAQQYPSLYNIVQRKQVSVANVLSHNPLNICFRRTLTENRWNMWLHLVHRLMNVHLFFDGERLHLFKSSQTGPGP
jgi:hypothetical protein